MISWLIMRGALSANIKKVHQTYYLLTMNGLATAIYETQAAAPTADETEAYLNHVHHQLAGVERLEGTYPFTLETSVRAYRLNRFLHRMIEPAHRQRFLADPEAAFAESQLTEEERDMVRRRDWWAMIHYGVIFFMLGKRSRADEGVRPTPRH